MQRAAIAVLHLSPNRLLRPFTRRRPCVACGTLCAVLPVDAALEINAAIGRKPAATGRKDVT